MFVDGFYSYPQVDGHPWYTEKLKNRLRSGFLEKWTSCLMHGTDKIRFKNCFDTKNRMQYMSSVQRHSGGFLVDPKLQSKCANSSGMDGLHLSCWSSAGLQVHSRRVSNRTRSWSSTETANVFFTAVDPVNSRRITPRFEANKPRIIGHTLQWRRLHNAVYRFDLNVAQTKELVLRQPITNAIILVTVARRNSDDTKTEILCRNKIPEQGEAARIKLRDVSSSEQAGRKSRARKGYNQVVAVN